MMCGESLVHLRAWDLLAVNNKSSLAFLKASFLACDQRTGVKVIRTISEKIQVLVLPCLLLNRFAGIHTIRI